MFSSAVIFDFLCILRCDVFMSLRAEVLADV